jgi:membrane associated rhomboid family serine protease
LIDLNHIFLFLAVVSPIAVLVRTWHLHAPNRGWRIAAFVVLAITGTAWLIFRHQAGYVGAAAWFALLFLPAIGLRRMTELSARHKYHQARQLARALHYLHPTADLREQIDTLRFLEARQIAGQLPPPSHSFSRPPLPDGNRLRYAPGVIVLIVANVLAYGIELWTGALGDNDGADLFQLGSLVPSAVVIGHQYWRLLAALFLHAGILHLSFNLFALYVIGPQLEKFGGTLRFLICYFVSGICSTAGVVLLWYVGILTDFVDAQGRVHPLEVVGASGCIMGIVGAMAGFLIRDRHMPMARRRLGNIVFIVVIQTLFDISTRQVSMSAHLCGLAGGVLIGLVVAPRNPWANVGRRPSF